MSCLYSRWTTFGLVMRKLGHQIKADSRLGPSQWEPLSQSDAVSLAGRKPRISPDIHYLSILYLWNLVSIGHPRLPFCWNSIKPHPQGSNTCRPFAKIVWCHYNVVKKPKKKPHNRPLIAHPSRGARYGVSCEYKLWLCSACHGRTV